jgi:arylsulfatase A-like enzyme
MFESSAKPICVLLLTFFASPCLAEGGTPPNIVFILADDLGYGEVGFNGQTLIKTPNLDDMAKQGVVFSSFYAGAPVCGPSRAAFLYGQHTGHVPIRGNPRWTVSGKPPTMKSDDVVISKELKRAGYATGIFGKWGMNEVFENQETGDGPGHPMRQGFDEFVGFNTHVEAHFHWPGFYWDKYRKVELAGGDRQKNFAQKLRYADDVFHEAALDFIDRKAKAGDAPFFLYMNYTAPHLGHTAPESSVAPYSDMGWPLNPDASKSTHYEMDEATLAAYAGMISHLDRQVGEILASLEEKGIADNTLVFFTSDNGAAIAKTVPDFAMFNSNNPFRGGKGNVTEGGLRMPTVALWPKVIRAGSTITTQLAFWDLLPTVCDIAGIRPQAATDGISFYPALLGNMDAQEEHPYLYWEYNEWYGPFQVVRKGEWKGIRSWDDGANDFSAMKLYHLPTDLREEKDVSRQHPVVTADVLRVMLEARSDHPEWTLMRRMPKM